MSASSATACLSMDEDYGWSHSLDAIAGKANGAVRYDMAPDELRREATGGDGQVNAEALCVARQELILPLQYLAHLTLHGADVHLRLLHDAVCLISFRHSRAPLTLAIIDTKTASNGRRSREMHSSQEAQGDTGGRSTQLVRRSGEWRPGWAMSKLQTVPIPTRLVFFNSSSTSTPNSPWLTSPDLASRVPSYREISLCLLSRPFFPSRTRITSAVDSAGEIPSRQSCFENPSPIGFGEAETNNHECDFAHLVVHCEKGRKPGGLIRPSLAAPPTARIRTSRRIRFSSRRHRTPRVFERFAAHLITADAHAAQSLWSTGKPSRKHDFRVTGAYV
ncbi:hypothetical protein CcaCcLH18_05781 [Colletotrichum camelliae]|nr:hypothetical protein CcaCcLH18_05781 [Colletotrichum camelliae]